VQATDKRPIEKLLEEHLEDFPFIFVSCGRGVYIPTSAEDINAYLDSLRSRQSKVYHRIKRLKAKAIDAGYVNAGRHVQERTHQDPLFSTTLSGSAFQRENHNSNSNPQAGEIHHG
jgi:hypothetical protein